MEPGMAQCCGGKCPTPGLFAAWRGGGRERTGRCSDLGASLGHSYDLCVSLAAAFVNLELEAARMAPAVDRSQAHGTVG